MRRAAPSLQRRLVVRLLLLNCGVLLLFGVAFVGLIVRADIGGKLTDPAIVQIAADAIRRDAGGGLRVERTEALQTLLEASPDTWFVARDAQGAEVRFGPVPAVYEPLSQRLDEVVFADIRAATAPYRYSAALRKATGPAGEFTVLGSGRLHSLTVVLVVLSNLLMVPIIVILALINLLATPWIVRRAFAGMEATAREAAKIDIHRRGYRLPVAAAPAEMTPLVTAVNGALQRLDDGYERHQRFILDAAHELRTPIAILQARTDGLEPSAATDRLRRDVQRLATLAEQLLDIQRIDRDMLFADDIDLALCARRVAADLAPLVIAGGAEIAVADLGARPVRGDAGAIERALTNLVQNAVEHGGDRVLLRVMGTTVEVEDNGPGVPPEERERIFEPFYRLWARSTGAGLGLSLVRQIMDLHGGAVEVAEAPDGGAILRLEFVAA